MTKNIKLPMFVASSSRISEMISSLRLLREEEWQSVYIDSNSMEEWIRYPLWDHHGPGPICLRRGNPSLEDILRCIEQSESDAEVSAAAYHLVNILDGGKENCAPLIERLESAFETVTTSRLMRNAALAIAWSQADRRFNYRSPLGKTPEQVEFDYEYFVAMANRASVIKTSAEAVLGLTISQKSTSFE